MLHTFFAFLWRVSILLLPWQTRWIFIDGRINSFPWEQGTVSFYASWIPMIAAIVLAFLIRRRIAPHAAAESVAEISVASGSQPSALSPRLQKRTNPSFTVGFILLLVASVFTVNLTATLVWWAYALLVGAFAWAVVAADVDRRTVSAWLVIAVVPHAALGIWQFLAQDIIGSTLLGIATHHPWERGASVIEHGLYRVLRAYGGLPHPNILGGWIAAALALLPGLISSARSKTAAYVWMAFGLVLTTALVNTFSRGAWIAAALAFGTGVFLAFFRARESVERQYVSLLAIVCLIAGVFGIVTQWDHIQTRIVMSERLEAWSTFSRTESFVQGWSAFTRRPIAGWGLGAGMQGIAEVRKGTMWEQIAPEPPHAAPAALVLETGILGIAALMVLAFGIRHSALRKQKSVQNPTSEYRLLRGLLMLDDRLPLVLALCVIALTDHYLVTLWPGIALLGVSAAIMRSREKQPPAPTA